MNWLNATYDHELQEKATQNCGFTTFENEVPAVLLYTIYKKTK